jgi:deazaflavin-dependent oxidoreductase (nitroreductase family)
MKPLMQMVLGLHIRIFRWSNGKVLGQLGRGRILLLTTVGRKTGQARTVPLMYIEDDHGNPAVAASYGGSPVPPAWFHNLSANPEVTVELRGRTQKSRARIAAPEERATLWTKLATVEKRFHGYEAKTKGIREIPMVVFDPI